METPSKTQVLIVGAGPTGLVLALWLKKKGINFRIIDKSAKAGETSRAIAVQARTLEFYRQLGIADEAIAEGISVQDLVLVRKGKEVARARLGALGKDQSAFPYLLFYPQDVHEKMLSQKLKELGTEVERGCELLSFVQDETSVTAIVKSANGSEKIAADYMCGSDGAKSTVRHLINSDFPGGTYSQVFFVADVIADLDKSKDEIKVTVSKEDFCIVMPVRSQNSVRLIGLVPPNSENKASITYEDVADRVKIDSGLNVTQVNWFSTYHVHHRIAEKFRQGRIFIAGDAGHIHSPAGGQGMNTGIGDAINLAWKLSDVISGRFDQRLLDSYEIERMAFARTLIRTTDRAFKLIASRSLVGSFFRPYILPTIFSILTKVDIFLAWAFRTISQIKIQYEESFLSQGSTRGLKAGHRLPWVKFDRGDNYESLQSLDWQIHIYGKSGEKFSAALANTGIVINIFSWNEVFESRGLQKNAVYLLRPDGYIGFISQSQDITSLKEYLRSIHRNF